MEAELMDFMGLIVCGAIFLIAMAVANMKKADE